MFKNIKLTTKIVSALSIIIIGMLIITATSYNGIHKIGEEIKEISEYEAPLLHVIVEIEKDVLKEEVLTLELILASKDVNSQEFKDIEQKIKAIESKTQKNISDCLKLSKKAADHAQDTKLKKEYIEVGDTCNLFEKEQKSFKKHLKILENDLKTNNIENIDHEKKVILKELDHMYKQGTELAYKMEELSHNLAVQAQKDEESILLIVEITAFIFLLIAIFISIVLKRDVTKNVNNFQNGLLDFFKYINKKSSDTKLLDDSSSDEIGTMAKVVNDNIRKAKTALEDDKKVINDTISVLSEFEQGDLAQRVHTQSNNPALQELTSLLNQMGSNIESNIDKALNVLEQYSNGNYINRVDTNNIKEHLLKLANGVNVVGESTTKLLSDNLEKGLTLQENATTLNDNVSKLSTSSNQQAASLEETSAALEEITSTISSNSGSVRKMSSLTNDLSTAVTSGERLANETSTSMNMIDEKVSSINEAITIIDQIAFQTNILSLNAAVEAATAGEAGKGFAVVAAEVRNLATRSADAAKDIKELVQSATNKAEEGKEISSKMIEGYHDLNKIILTTVELINEVSSASSEQQKGIEQINDAVSQLDKATQENATVASQTSDIAKDTNDMSVQIVEEVSKSDFNGKNEIKAIKSVTKNKSDDRTIINNNTSKPKNKIRKQETNNNVVVSNNDTDEWESF